MKKSTITQTALLSFLVGITIHSGLDFLNTTYLLILSGTLTFSLLAFSLWSKTKKIKSLQISLLITLFLALGLTRGISSIHHPTPNTVDYYNNTNETITIIGTIADEPDIRRNKINYTIQPISILLPTSVKDNNSPSPAKERGLGEEVLNDTIRPKLLSLNPNPHLLISTGKYPAYQYGNRLEITGKLQTPAQFDSFDYAAYLSRFNTYSVMYRPNIKRAPPAKGELSHFRATEGVWKVLLSTKKYFEQALYRAFPSEPSSSFLAGLLLGSRKGIPENLTKDFQTVGLTHIIAISGYNITIIVTLLMAMLKPLGQKPAILISGVGIILFTLFVGASPAVVRACIMGLLALLALNSNRKAEITLILLLTATLMVGYNPKILLHDVGFQLSFLATMGLIYISPILEPYLHWLPNRLAIRESISLTLSAQIMAMPIILLNFQTLSIISPLANLLIAGPIIPLAMLFGFLSTLIAFVFLPLAKLIGFPAFLLLNYITFITQTLANIPLASVNITSFTKPFFYLYFIALTVFLIWYYRKRFPEKQLSLLIQNQRSMMKRHLKEMMEKLPTSVLIKGNTHK